MTNCSGVVGVFPWVLDSESLSQVSYVWQWISPYSEAQSFGLILRFLHARKRVCLNVIYGGPRGVSDRLNETRVPLNATSNFGGSLQIILT